MILLTTYWRKPMALISDFALKMKSKENISLIFFLAIFFILNALTIMEFPSVHSDELWLKGIADASKSAKSIWVTEPFFDLYPRSPHPFRWLYVSLENIFIKGFGNSVATMRLLSLSMSTLALYTFYHLLKVLKLPAFWGLFSLMFNISFIYTSRFGRQESSILFIFLLAIYTVIRFADSKLSLSGILPAMITFLAIGIHPNSFIIAVVTVSIMFVQCFQKKRSTKSILIYLLTLTFSFGLWVGLSEWTHSGFFKAYLNYGASLGLDHAPLSRLNLFIWYFRKIYNQIGGTYDIMNLKWLMAIGLLMLINPKLQNIGTLGMASTALALFLIGRNNQLAIVFFMPWLVIAFLYTVKALMQKYKTLILSVFLLTMTYNAYVNIHEYALNMPYVLDYQDMIEILKASIPEESTVLGNLNTIEAFDENRFYDLRNLGYLEAHGMTLEEYIALHHIEYIVLHDEMNYIQRTSPTWDFLYVNTSYFDELFDFVQSQCTPVIIFENPVYAMRISMYSGTYPWRTSVYKVKTIKP